MQRHDYWGEGGRQVHQRQPPAAMVGTHIGSEPTIKWPTRLIMKEQRAFNLHFMENKLVLCIFSKQRALGHIPTVACGSHGLNSAVSPVVTTPMRNREITKAEPSCCCHSPDPGKPGRVWPSPSSSLAMILMMSLWDGLVPRIGCGPGSPGVPFSFASQWVFPFLTEQSEGGRDALNLIYYTAILLTDFFILPCCICMICGLSFCFPTVFSQLPFCQGRLLFDSSVKQFYGNHVLGMKMGSGGWGGAHVLGLQIAWRGCGTWCVFWKSSLGSPPGHIRVLTCVRCRCQYKGQMVCCLM